MQEQQTRPDDKRPQFCEMKNKGNKREENFELLLQYQVTKIKSMQFLANKEIRSNTENDPLSRD